MSFPKIAFIGAGSTVFMRHIVGDILQRPGSGGSTIALMDIRPATAPRKRDRSAQDRRVARRSGDDRNPWR